jgi:hypothetical protein
MVQLTRKEIQERLCAIMYKLDNSDNAHIFVPSESLEIDLDFLSILASYTMLDLESKVREAGGRK